MNSTAPWQRIALNSHAGTWPVLQLPLDGRVEQILAARDRILAALPDAVIVARGDFPRVAAHARAWRSAQDPETAQRLLLPVLLGLYVLLLLILRLKPPLDYRLRALLELLGVTAVPLGLVVGGFIGDDIDPFHLAACADHPAFRLEPAVRRCTGTTLGANAQARLVGRTRLRSS